jgi:hypothetical protein
MGETDSSHQGERHQGCQVSTAEPGLPSFSALPIVGFFSFALYTIKKRLDLRMKTKMMLVYLKFFSCCSASDESLAFSALLAVVWTLRCL